MSTERESTGTIACNYEGEYHRAVEEMEQLKKHLEDVLNSRDILQEENKVLNDTVNKLQSIIDNLRGQIEAYKYCIDKR